MRNSDECIRDTVSTSIGMDGAEQNHNLNRFFTVRFVRSMCLQRCREFNLKEKKKKKEKKWTKASALQKRKKIIAFTENSILWYLNDRPWMCGAADMFRSIHCSQQCKCIQNSTDMRYGNLHVDFLKNVNLKWFSLVLWFIVAASCNRECQYMIRRIDVRGDVWLTVAIPFNRSQINWFIFQFDFVQGFGRFVYISTHLLVATHHLLRIFKNKHNCAVR